MSSPRSPRSPKSSRFTQKLRSKMAPVEEETSPKGRGQNQLPRLNLSQVKPMETLDFLDIHQFEDSNIRRLEPMGFPKKNGNELQILKMSLDKCDPENIYELVKEYATKSATPEDIEYATSKFAHIKPFITQMQIRKMEQLIRTKNAVLNKGGKRKSRKSRKSHKLTRKSRKLTRK